MADIGRAPSRRDYDAWRDRLPDPREAPHSTQVRPAFESGRAARAALGEPMPDIVALRLVSRNRRAWSRAELIDALRRCGDALERRSFSFRRYSSFATDNRLPRSREAFARASGTGGTPSALGEEASISQYAAWPHRAAAGAGLRAGRELVLPGDSVRIVDRGEGSGRRVAQGEHRAVSGAGTPSEVAWVISGVVVPHLSQPDAEGPRRLLGEGLAGPGRGLLREARLGLPADLVAHRTGEIPTVESYQAAHVERALRGETWPAHSTLLRIHRDWIGAVRAAMELGASGGFEAAMRLAREREAGRMEHARRGERSGPAAMTARAEIGRSRPPPAALPERAAREAAGLRCAMACPYSSVPSSPRRRSSSSHGPHLVSTRRPRKRLGMAPSSG